MGIFSPWLPPKNSPRRDYGNWRQASPQDLPDLALFLLSRESLGLNLLDSFFQARHEGHMHPGTPRGKPCLSPFKNDWWSHFVVEAPGNCGIRACLAFSTSGYVHSLGSDVPDLDWKAGFDLLQFFTPRLHSRLFGAILDEPGALNILPFLQERIRHRNTYRVLELPAVSSGIFAWMPPPQPPRLEKTSLGEVTIRAGTPKDAGLLLDIQCAYELEEVLCPGQLPDPEQSRARLEFFLQKHRIYLVQRGSEAVAKAGTNALSWNYLQVGGVYTSPDWRRQGLAKELVSLLIEDGRSCGLGACLFVKEKNSPALKVYDHLGFCPCGSLDIVYFK